MYFYFLNWCVLSKRSFKIALPYFSYCYTVYTRTWWHCFPVSLSYLAQQKEWHHFTKPTWVSVDGREDSSSLEAGGRDSLSGGGSDCWVEALIFPSSDFALCSVVSFTTGPFICCCPWAWAFALCWRLSRCCWYQYCCCSYNRQKFSKTPFIGKNHEN